MEIISHVAGFVSVPYQKLSFLDQLLPQHQLLQPKPCYYNQQSNRFRRRNCVICDSSLKKSRGSRKVKSNVELFNDIRDFVKTVGFPEDHVPTTKELSQHGRADLANIVRRRGYKFIKELLASSTITGENDSETRKCLTDTDGQAEKMNNGDEQFSTPIEVPVVEKNSSGLDTDSRNDVYLSTEVSNGRNYLSFVSNYNSDDSSSSAVAFSTNLSEEENYVYDLNGHTAPGLNLDRINDNPIDLSVDLPLEEEAFNCLNGYVKKANNLVEDFSSSSEVSSVENHSSCTNVDSSPNSLEHCYMPVQSSFDRILTEKVAKFIQNGDLDAVDDNFHPMISGSGSEGSKNFIESETTTWSQSSSAAEAYLEEVVTRGYDSIATNGISVTSRQIASSSTLNESLRNDQQSDEELGGQVDKDDLDVETSRESEVEISHLKFMMNQKELELSRLKEQIEKDTLALSILQTKAETDIGKAQNLILEKDLELHQAEESLSGLEEVEIQYSGEGEIVELGGSFNGWDQRIRMDLLPSNDITDSTGSRKPRLWSIVLWLYPGTYEIKFIVDGQWRIDPQRETITTGTICNNILLVES